MATHEEARQWPLTRLPGADLPPLQEAWAGVQRVQSALDEACAAWHHWRAEYDRVLKAMYGYEWVHGPAPESPDALYAAEAAYQDAMRALVALVGPAATTMRADD